MFGIGKKSVYKLLKESPDEFKDLCKLGDSDVETAVDASRKLVSGYQPLLVNCLLPQSNAVYGHFCGF
jgi:hypothetical protein